MSTEGLSLALVLLCLLRVQAVDLGTVEPDESKIAGTWYITAMASDSESYLQKKDQLKMAMANIEVLENGDLNVSFAIPTPGRCMKFSSIYKPTDNPGEYYSSGASCTSRLVAHQHGRPPRPSLWDERIQTKLKLWGKEDRGNKTVQLVDTDGSSYMVVFATREKDGKTLHMLRLYSRSQWVRTKTKLLFKRLAKLNGFTDKTIWILPRQEECLLGEP